MMRTRRLQPFAQLVLAMAIALSAHSQNAPIPTVASEGVATERIAASFVTFTLQEMPDEQSLRAAAEKALEFPKRVRDALNERKLRAQSIEDTGVRILHVSGSQTQTSISVRVKFPIVRFSSDPDKIKAYASLCDDVYTLAHELGCRIQSPTLVAENPELVEQQAIARATENALYKADAVAPLLESQIFAVQEVEVLEVKWLGDGALSYGSGALSMSCHARVRVVYTLAALR